MLLILVSFAKPAISLRMRCTFLKLERMELNGLSRSVSTSPKVYYWQHGRRFRHNIPPASRTRSTPKLKRVLRSFRVSSATSQVSIFVSSVLSSCPSSQLHPQCYALFRRVPRFVLSFFSGKLAQIVRAWHRRHRGDSSVWNLRLPGDPPRYLPIPEMIRQAQRSRCLRRSPCVSLTWSARIGR